MILPYINSCKFYNKFVMKVADSKGFHTVSIDGRKHNISINCGLRCTPYSSKRVPPNSVLLRCRNLRWATMRLNFNIIITIVKLLFVHQEHEKKNEIMHIKNDVLIRVDVIYKTRYVWVARKMNRVETISFCVHLFEHLLF